MRISDTRSHGVNDARFNINHSEKTVDKAKKTVQLGTTPTTINSNFSFVEIDNEDGSNHAAIVDMIRNIVLSSDDNVSDIEDEASTDSDDENIPDYEEELRSRWYYYASFVYQQDSSNREIDGCANPDEPPTTVCIKDSDDDDLNSSADSSDNVKQPMKDSVMSHTHFLTLDFSELVNETSVSEKELCVPRTSSSLLYKHVIDGDLFVFETTDAHIGDCDNEANVLDNCKTEPGSFSCEDRTLSVRASSTICMDEFSIADSEIEPSQLMPNKKVHILRRATTLYNLNDTKRPAHPVCANLSKNSTASNRLLKAVKCVKRSLTPTRKKNRQCNDNDSDGQELTSPARDVQLLDRRNVARKFRRFRDSFRRKDKRQIQTLAML